MPLSYWNVLGKDSSRYIKKGPFSSSKTSEYLRKDFIITATNDDLHSISTPSLLLEILFIHQTVASLRKMQLLI